VPASHGLFEAYVGMPAVYTQLVVLVWHVGCPAAAGCSLRQLVLARVMLVLVYSCMWRWSYSGYAQL